MNPKVSIIIPAYNAQSYIALTFESILKQAYDNIELIIINDGSTDDTAKIISEYVPKFQQRGFAVIVKETKNHGVAAAVLEGLSHITGAFFCQIDADDTISLEFISKRIEFLVKNDDVDIAACNTQTVPWSRQSRLLFPYESNTEAFKLPFRLLEMWLSGYADGYIPLLLIRTSYFHQCNMALYSLRCKNSQEPPMHIVLGMGGGNVAYFPDKLYNYRITQGSIVSGTTHHVEKCQSYASDYFHAYQKALHQSALEMTQKKRLINMARINTLRMVYSTYFCILQESFDDRITGFMREYENTIIRLLNRDFSNYFCLKPTDILEFDPYLDYLLKCFSRRSVGQRSFVPCAGKKFIVYGYGSYFKTKLLELQKYIRYDEIWSEDEGYIKPDFDSLNELDTVLLLIDEDETERQIINRLGKIQNVISHKFFYDFIADICYLN